MSIFIALLSKIIPIYFSIIIGFYVSKIFKIKSHHIAFLIVYILAPAVIFFASLSININLQVISIPIILFTFSTISAFFVLYNYKKLWKDSSINTLAFTCGSGNTGYFGIPLAIIILEPQYVNIYIFTTLASTMYEYTIGFYIMAKGSFSSIQSLKKVLKLPLVYAFILGISLNILSFKLPAFLLEYFDYTKYLYGLLGMMILGMGFKDFNFREDFDKKFILLAYLHKFLLWPLFIILIQILDRLYFNFFNKELYFIMFLFSIVPMAGNTVTFAILCNTKPQKASISVLMSTALSLLSIPIMLLLYELFVE